MEPGQEPKIDCTVMEDDKLKLEWTLKARMGNWSRAITPKSLP